MTGLKGALASDYGTSLRSVYTLRASITGGVSWREVLGPLIDTAWPHESLQLLCLFSIFSVLDIVAGAFAYGAIQRSSQERDLINVRSGPTTCPYNQPEALPDVPVLACSVGPDAVQQHSSWFEDVSLFQNGR